MTEWCRGTKSRTEDAPYYTALTPLFLNHKPTIMDSNLRRRAERMDLEEGLAIQGW